MMTTRTADQKLADDLDCDLYRIIIKAERQSKDKRWRQVAKALREARPHIRALMHADDRRETADPA